MTDRLYYTDPYLRAFDATIARVRRRDNRLVLTLDRTAFYPTSGGQPFDTGRLGPFRVVDVIDEDDGSISHVVENVAQVVADVAQGFSPAIELGPRESGLQLAIGQSVHGEIDWVRRFDHMQQHTGQHVLSAAFDKLFGVRTVSFHLGGAVSTIDLARELSPAEIAAAEAEANRIVWEDRPVAIRFADADEAARLPLRKEPARRGTLRLIDVEGFDLSACGGTHVARTGGIGVIAVASWERFKGGQRLECLCGGRALGGYRTLRDAMTASVRLLSVLPAELPSAIERLQTDAREQKRSLVALHGELARHRAEELAAGAVEVRLKPAATSDEVRLKADTTEPKAVSLGPQAVASGFSRTSSAKLVLRALDADANALKALATAIAAKPGYLVVLVSTSTPALAVIARSADVSVSAQQLLAALIAQFGGRGGGRPEMAQGGGLDGPADAIIDAVRAAL
jgi:alanyl-tRNA synthetase